MKTLILIRGDRYQLWSAENESDAKYHFKRRIEKEGFRATLAYLVDDTQKLPVEQWEKEYDEEEAKWYRADREAKELSEYERLKKKFEQS
jgi:hypothetical protein